MKDLEKRVCSAAKWRHPGKLRLQSSLRRRERHSEQQSRGLSEPGELA